MKSLIAAATAAVALATVVPGCGGSGSTSSGPITVVAAENFWGSIASRLAGTKAKVQSIISNPATDPHSYEPAAGDARTIATARLVIVNGLGYDAWAQKLLAANPVPGRIVLTVGSLLGLKPDDNPHRWYDPADVDRITAAITADLKKLDPKDAAYFDHEHAAFESQRLAGYHRLIAAIKARYKDTPVGASESIFALQAPALGLTLLTPPAFMKAISEGTDVTAQDLATAEQQITDGRIKVWVYNSQNATPAVKRLTALARQHGVPVTTITETLTPPTASFEDWQLAQLRRLEQALKRATGR